MRSGPAGPSGFIVLRGVVEPARIAAANAAIDADLATNYDPARQEEYDHQSACPDIRTAPAIRALLEAPALAAAIDTVLFTGRMRWDRGQIAVRWPHNHAEPMPVEPHLDGMATPQNGLVGPMLYSFTALVGVFLTPSHGPYSGNFTVWPGSTAALAEWYRTQGRRGMLRGMPDAPLGDSEQLEVAPGDAVICNYLLAHGCSVNTSPVQRRAVFFRGTKRGLTLHRYASLVSPWRDWRATF